MALITVILVLVAIGVLMYLVNQHVPMAPQIKTLLNWLVVVILIIWILNLFGLWHYLGVIQVPQVK